MVGLPGERAGAGSGAAGEGDAVEAVRVPWGDPATDGRPHFEDWVRVRPSLMWCLRCVRRAILGEDSPAGRFL